MEKLVFAVTENGVQVDLEPTQHLEPLFELNSNHEIYLRGKLIGIVDETGQILYKNPRAAVPRAVKR